MKRTLSFPFAYLTTATLGAVVVVGWGFIFEWHLPYIDMSPTSLAKYLAENDRDPLECWDLIIIDIFGPQAAVQRARCIYEYAELSKKPETCESLMPSTYGLMCVGAGEIPLPCDLGAEKYSVYWSDVNGEHTVHVRECVNGKDQGSLLGNSCCQVAKVAFLKSENDCSSLQQVDSDIYDKCLSSLAWKQRDEEICVEISSKNARTACIVRTKAMKQNPGICSGCTQAVENVSEL